MEDDEGGNVGSDALLRLVMAKRLRIHAFGHMHRHYGMTLLNADPDEGSVLLVNAAICDDENRATRLPITVNLV